MSFTLKFLLLISNIRFHQKAFGSFKDEICELVDKKFFLLCFHFIHFVERTPRKNYVFYDIQATLAMCMLLIRNAIETCIQIMHCKLLRFLVNAAKISLWWVV